MHASGQLRNDGPLWRLNDAIAAAANVSVARTNDASSVNDASSANDANGNAVSIALQFLSIAYDKYNVCID